MWAGFWGVWWGPRSSLLALWSHVTSSPTVDPSGRIPVQPGLEVPARYPIDGVRKGIRGILWGELAGSSLHWITLHSFGSARRGQLSIFESVSLWARCSREAEPVHPGLRGRLGV